MHQIESRISSTEWAFVLLVCITLSFLNICSYSEVSYQAGNLVDKGWLVYRDMSEHGLKWDPGYPFNMRKLSVWLAAGLIQLGFHPNMAWLFLTASISSFCYVAHYFLFRKYAQFDLYTSLLWTVLAATTYWYNGFLFRWYWMVDPINNLTIILGLLAVLYRKYVLFSFVILIGLINKEVPLLLLPLPLIQIVFDEKKSLKETKQIIIKIMPQVLSVLAISVFYLCYRSMWAWFHGYNEFLEFGSNGQMSAFQNAITNLTAFKELRHIWDVFDFIWIFFFLGLIMDISSKEKQSSLGWITLYLLFALTYFRLFTDTPRAYVLLQPIVLLYAAKEFDSISNESQKLKVYSLLIIIFLYECVMQGGAQYVMRFGWADPSEKLIFSFGGIAVFGILLIYSRLKLKIMIEK